MRQTTVAILIVLAGAFGQAATLTCDTFGVGDDGAPIHFGVVGGGDFYCESEEGPRRVDFVNFGPGLKATRSQIVIRCSQSNPTGRYAVVGASCALLGGCELRLAAGSRGVCVVAGLNWGFGAEVSVGSMIIYEPWMRMDKQ